MDLAGIRKEYRQGGLSKCQAPDDPFTLFAQWLQQAVEAGVTEPTAMVVATVSPEGRPSTRTVLLKEFGDGKFVFYTNYESRKGRQLALNPNISLSFPWYQLERQVHIEGIAEQLPPEASDAYFYSRPLASRIGAVVSPQSRVIHSRTGLLRDFQYLREQCNEEMASEDHLICRPRHWGGYAVTPDRIEFWQGRESRLHDRILYVLGPDSRWKKERLAP